MVPTAAEVRSGTGEFSGDPVLAAMYKIRACYMMRFKKQYEETGVLR